MVQSLVHQLENINNPPCATFDKTIDREDFELWKKDFTWDALHGLRYGQSFCNRFGITDNILFYERDCDRADKHIRNHYISK
jgi:hypothetical protein